MTTKVGAAVSTDAVRVTVATLPAVSALVTVNVALPLVGKLAVGTVALHTPEALAETVTSVPDPVAIVTLRLASVVPESATPAVLSAALITPSVAMLALLCVTTKVGAAVSTPKVNALEVPTLPAASACLAVIDLPLPCPSVILFASVSA